MLSFFFSYGEPVVFNQAKQEDIISNPSTHFVQHKQITSLSKNSGQGGGGAPRYLLTLLNLSYHFIGPPSISMNSIFQFLCSCIMTSSPFINLGSYIMYEQDEPKSHLYTLWVIPKFVVCVWSKDSIMTHIRGVYKRGRDRGTVKKLRIIFFCRQR